MGKLVEGLLAYLNRSSIEQLIKDCEELDRYNEIGPEVNDFIKQSIEFNSLQIDNLISEVTFSKEYRKSGFYSGFFLYLMQN